MASERWDIWRNASENIFVLLRNAQILQGDIIRIGRLDCLLCEIETDFAKVLDSNESHKFGESVEFSFLLARSWLSMAYEALGAVNRQLVDKPVPKAKWNDQLKKIYDDLHCARVAEFKHEIPHDRRMGGPLIVSCAVTGEILYQYRLIKGIEKIAKDLYSPSRGYRHSDGTVFWRAFDVNVWRPREIYRRDVADELLAVLSQLKQQS